MNTFLQQDWEGIAWSDWVSLHASLSDFRSIPQSPGFYRVRVVGQPVLAYIGQTGRNTRQRLGELRRPLYLSDEVMPWNDPHTAAQSLWVLRIAEGMLFECSAAASDLDTQSRQAVEDMLLWRYRVEKGESTLCNHGRFHARYYRSTNRREGKPGGQMPVGKSNPASEPSMPPLSLHGEPYQDDWMNLQWSTIGDLATADLAQVPDTGGVYKIWDDDTKRLLYIGESANLQSRLFTHARKIWGHFSATAAFHTLGKESLVHQRHEIETDLLGAYYFKAKQPPVFQYTPYSQGQTYT